MKFICGEFLLLNFEVLFSIIHRLYINTLTFKSKGLLKKLVLFSFVETLSRKPSVNENDFESTFLMKF